jgi:anti-anti-sigma factor
VLTLFGELDLASSPALEEELDRRVGTEAIVVDLRELEFIDSTGLSVLVRSHQRAIDTGLTFGIVSARDGQVQRLLDLTGLLERLRVAGTPEELLSGI